MDDNRLTNVCTLEEHLLDDLPAEGLWFTCPLCTALADPDSIMRSAEANSQNVTVKPGGEYPDFMFVENTTPWPGYYICMGCNSKQTINPGGSLPLSKFNRAKASMVNSSSQAPGLEGATATMRDQIAKFESVMQDFTYAVPAILGDMTEDVDIRLRKVFNLEQKATELKGQQAHLEKEMERQKADHIANLKICDQELAEVEKRFAEISGKHRMVIESFKVEAYAELRTEIRRELHERKVALDQQQVALDQQKVEISMREDDIDQFLQIAMASEGDKLKQSLEEREAAVAKREAAVAKSEAAVERVKCAIFHLDMVNAQ